MLSIFAIIVPTNIIGPSFNKFESPLPKNLSGMIGFGEKNSWISYMYFCYYLLFEDAVAVHLNKCEWIDFIQERFVPIVRLAETGQVVSEKKMKMRNVCRQTDGKKARKMTQGRRKFPD